MLCRLLFLLSATALVIQATPTFHDCHVLGTGNPPFVCDWWTNGVISDGAPGPIGPVFPSVPAVTLSGFRFRPNGPWNYVGATPVNIGDTQTASYLAWVSFWMNGVQYRTQTTSAASSVTLTGITPIPAGLARFYSGELLQLDFALGGYLFRESPTLQSLGETSLSDNAQGFVDAASFFDVFLELSADGGQTWIPAANSVRLEATPNIPEPGTWTLACIGAAATLFARRFRQYASRPHRS